MSKIDMSLCVSGLSSITLDCSVQFTDICDRFLRAPLSLDALEHSKTDDNV